MSEASYEQYFSLQSAHIKKTTEFLALKTKRLEEERKAEEKENISCWTKVINHNYGYELDHYPYTVIPTGSKKIIKLSTERKNLFREHLTGLISEVISELAVNRDNGEGNQIEEDMPLDEDVENESPFEATACAICRGGCCRTGDDHAFLKKETILRYISRHPDHKPKQLLDIYMAYLPEKSFEDSCINHRVTGCTLPRDLRSDVCNEFMCDSLVKLRDLFLRTPVPKGVFFIRRAQNNLNKDNLDMDNRIIGSELVLNDMIYPGLTSRSDGISPITAKS